MRSANQAQFVAREDVVRVKKLVKHSHSVRESRNMQPSQRAPNSLERVRLLSGP